MTIPDTQKVDAAIVLTGTGYDRPAEGKILYDNRKVQFLVIVGPDSFLSKESHDAKYYKKWLLEQYSKDEDDYIIAINGESGTHNQADAIVKKIIEMEWKKIILVASAFHIPRAYMVFLKFLMKNDLDKKVTMIPHSVHDTWFRPTLEIAFAPLDQKTRLQMEEMPKIHKYSGPEFKNCATFDELETYLSKIYL